MSYLLDTNILSETIKDRPSKSLLAWLNSVPQDDLYISVLTYGEIRKGVERLSSGKRKSQLLSWLENELANWFGEKIIAIDLDIANRWGFLCSHSNESLPTIDSLLAATALAYNLKLVTRNVSDFDFPGLQVINPF